MDDTEYMELKHITSRIYDYCMKYWPEEFKNVFVADKVQFMNWINFKTGLYENHITDRRKALKSWLLVLANLKD